jgi:hypothetical protein
MSTTPYKPLSKAPVLETVLPESMAYETATALARLHEYCGGDVDTWVQRELMYPDVPTMWSHFAAEQIDGIGLAIMNIEKNAGTIIADQTGIGKGRQAAAIIRYAILRSIPCTFVTVKADLFSDMYRDLCDIGFGNEIRPLVFNDDAKAIITTEIKGSDGENILIPVHELDGMEYFRPITGVKKKRLMQSDYDQMPDGYNAIFTTYSQLTGDEIARKAAYKLGSSKKPYKEGTADQTKTTFLRNYIPNGIFILDESHEAGGSSSNIGLYMQEVLEKAKGCVFLSATFAKKPENMQLYTKKTALSNAQLKTEDLAQVFKSAGVALQEAMASELAAEGQLVRRQRSYDNLKFDSIILSDFKDKHREIYDGVMQICREIMNFETNHITPIFDDWKDGIKKAESNIGINTVEFASKLHNMVSQLVFSLKAESVAKRAIELMNQDKKVIIAFSNTFGSFLDSLEYKNGERITNQSFSLILEVALKNTLRYSQTEANGDPVPKVLEFNDLPYDAQVKYEQLVDAITNLTEDITMSPLDVLINMITHTKRPNDKIEGSASAYYRVGECTGRAGRVTSVDGHLTYIRIKNMPKKNFSEFNAGDCDCLLINQSAATGVSAHASANFNDKRERVMLLVQAELNINTQVQKLGRINRSGQVTTYKGRSVLPSYEYLISDIPTEKRMMMIGAKKLKSLDANTSGNQNNSKDTLDGTVDFFNKYGFYIAASFLVKSENAGMLDRMGGMQKIFKVGEDKVYVPIDPAVGDIEIPGESGDKKKGEVIAANEDGLLTITNRVALLDCADQELFYNSVTDEYLKYIKRLDAAGDNDLLIENLPYEAVLQSSQVLVPQTTGLTSFGIVANADTYEVNNLRKPFSKEQIQALINNALKGTTAEELQQKAKELLDKNYASNIKSYKNSIIEAEKRKIELIAEHEANIKEIDDAIVALSASEKKADIKKLESKQGQREKQLAKLENVIASNAADYYERSIVSDEATYDTLTHKLQNCKIGSTIRYQGGLAVITGMKINEKSPLSFIVEFDIAIPNGLRKDEIYLYRAKTDISATESKLLENWHEAVKANSADRQTVRIVTGNILTGFTGALKNAAEGERRPKMIKFTMADGTIKTGIQMGMPSGNAKPVLKIAIRFDKITQIPRLLNDTIIS